jgi:hypothetical protein
MSKKSVSVRSQYYKSYRREHKKIDTGPRLPMEEKAVDNCYNKDSHNHNHNHRLEVEAVGSPVEAVVEVLR